MTEFAHLNLTVYAQLQTLRCSFPDLSYNAIIFFDWQEHSGIFILKPYQKMQSRQYGPGMLSLSGHGLWLITRAKCGTMYIRDVHTLVSFLKKLWSVYLDLI